MKITALVVGVIVLLLLIFGGINEISSANTRLENAQADLNAKTVELSSVQNQLAQKDIELSATKGDLVQTKSMFEQAIKDLTVADAEKANLATKLDTANADLDKEYKVADEAIKQSAESVALAEKATKDAEAANKNIALYKETFGEVFEGVAPTGLTNDSTPVTFRMPLPLSSAPTRKFKLVENPNAKNPTYAELLAFLTTDITDSFRYVYDYYMCGNFAETVHNNAEAAGIRAGLVEIRFNFPPGHAINAFLTTDKGLVYIDCTGTDIWGPSSMDGIVDYMRIGSTYERAFLFPSLYYFLPDSKTITDIEIYW
jgi:hypothetical protein